MALGANNKISLTDLNALMAKVVAKARYCACNCNYCSCNCNYCSCHTYSCSCNTQCTCVVNTCTCQSHPPCACVTNPTCTTDGVIGCGSEN